MTDFLTVTMAPALDLSTTASRVEHTHKIRCASPNVHPGGGGINVSRVIQRLGGDCLALYPVGGANGEVLRKMLARENVPSYCINISEETRQNFTVHDTSTGKDFRFVLPGASLTPAESRACLSFVSELEAPARYFVASGSLPGGAPADFYAELARLAKRKGSLMVLDTSGEALGLALVAGVFMVKPSLRELQELTGTPLTNDATRIQAAQKIIGAGQAQIVALSLGEEGALLVTSEIALRAKGLLVNVAGTVGAGDSFVAGFLWALHRHADLNLALRYGVAAGAAALLTGGTALCKVLDIEKLLHEVMITSLSLRQPDAAKS
jgi:6-phosphofructokinase 2